MSKKNRKFIQLVLDKGADPTLCDEFGYTPIIHAIRIGYITGLRLLLKNERQTENINQINKTGTALSHAVHSHMFELAKMLIKHGAIIDETCVRMIEEKEQFDFVEKYEHIITPEAKPLYNKVRMPFLFVS